MFDKMINEKDIDIVKNLIDKSKKCVILTHSRPDGDAMGSSLSLALFISSLNRHVSVVVPNDYPPFLSWMPTIENVIIYDRSVLQAENLLKEADLFFCLDFNSFSRIGDLGKIVESVVAKRVLIDHHLSPDDVFDVSISHPEACSTAELVFGLLWQMSSGKGISKEMAECIYTGMMTDTGNFAYASNRKNVFSIVAELVSKGINKDFIYRRVFYNYSFSRMKLMGYMMYEKLRYFPEKNAALLTLDNDELKRFNVTKGDTEGFVNMPLQIKGVRFSCFLREEIPNKINVSLRSVDDFPCNEVAERFFNGGSKI